MHHPLAPWRFAALLALGACATPGGELETPPGDLHATLPDGTPAPQGSADPSQTRAAGGAQGPRGAHAADDRWPVQRQGAATPTVLRWITAERLQIGYSDGVVVDLDLAQRHARARSVGEAGAPIVALGPQGRWAVLGSTPATLVDLDAARVLMELQRVDKLAATTFAEDASRWYVSGADGHIFIWSREKLIGTAEGDDLRAVLTRSKPDLHAALPAIAAPLLASGPTTLTFANPEGDILQWDVSSQEISTLLSMEAAVQDLSATDRFIAVTAANGRLRVLDLQAGHFTLWSLKATATRAHLAFGSTPQLAVQHAEGRTVQLLRADSGQALWTQPLPPGGDLCGVAAAPGGSAVAACVDGVVALLSGDDGHLLSAVTQERGQLRWRNAAGAEIAP